MKYTSHCLALCGVGLALIVAGLLWSQSLGNRAVWSEEQALRFNEVSARYHQAAHSAMHGDEGHEHDGHDHPHTDDELTAAKAAWEAQKQARDDAIAQRDFWRKVLLGGGMLAIILGGGSYLIVKNVLEE